MLLGPVQVLDLEEQQLVPSPQVDGPLMRQQNKQMHRMYGGWIVRRCRCDERLKAKADGYTCLMNDFEQPLVQRSRPATRGTHRYEVHVEE